MIKLDPTDRKILQILQENAKITNAQLSKDVGLSPAPTLERVKKLETSGVIKSYHAKLDNEKVGLGVTTYIIVHLDSHKKNDLYTFIDAINSIEEITECHHVTGNGDFILKVVAKDIGSYQRFILDKLSNLDGVSNTQTMVVLATYKESASIPLP
jgi:DNA-binding Lrp family transcriptional regulator